MRKKENLEKKMVHAPGRKGRVLKKRNRSENLFKKCPRALPNLWGSRSKHLGRGRRGGTTGMVG